MAAIATVYDYLRNYGKELGERITEHYKPVHSPSDAVSPLLAKLKRKPLPAQEIAIMATAKYLKDHDSARIVGECGSGKTLMGLATCYVHAAGRRFTGLAMCPPHLPLKWAREVLVTLPDVRVFLIETMRNDADPRKPNGIVEVQYNRKTGKVERKGIKFTLSELRAMGRKGFRELVPDSAFFVMSKERAKLGYFWRDAFQVARSGPNNGYALSMDSGLPIENEEVGGYLSQVDFRNNLKFSHKYDRPKGGSQIHTALWQADRTKIQRMAPLDYMGRYMHDFFDYALADELHQLNGDTAQGNGLAVLARIARKTIGLTGTMMGGYAADLFGILWRMDAPMMARDGFQWGSSGRAVFQSLFGVCEEVRKTPISDNACSDADRTKVRIKNRPGASPLLFGKYLMESTAFVSLEDISADMPAYREEIVPVPLTGALEKAYCDIEQAIKDALKEYGRNASLASTMIHTLLNYPDAPFNWQPITAKIFNKRTQEHETIQVCTPESLDKSALYPKEEALLDDVKKELREGRRVQVYACYTGENDVNARLKSIFERAGLRVAVLRSTVPTEKREAWYQDRLAEGVQVVIAHPKLVETGLDLLEFPTLYFYETGFSLYVLRQASRRSWRIGQKKDVRVKFLMYEGTSQETQLKLMGKKLLVSLMMEGKFSGEGLDAFDEDDGDIVATMVRELLEEGKVGESADAIWKNLERERSLHMVAPTTTEVEAVVQQIAADSGLPYDGPTEDSSEPEPSTPYLVTANAIIEETPTGGTGLFQFALSGNSTKKRKSKSPVYEGQLGLFGE